MSIKDERTLDLRKIIYYVVLRWKFIICFAIVIALLLVGVKICKDVFAIKNNEQITELNLTVEERKNVEDAIYYYNQIKQARTYFAESYMLNANEFETERLSYVFMIELDGEEYSETEFLVKLSNIMSSYQKYITCCLPDSIASRCGEGENKYIREALRLEVNVYNPYSSTMTIEMYTVEGIDDIQQLLETELQKHKVVVDEMLGKHELTLVDVYKSAVVNRDWRDIQRTLMTSIAADEEKLERLKSEFTESQFKYYQDITGELIEIQEENKITPLKWIVFFVLGLLIGIVASISIVVFKYMLSNQIVSESDYYNMFGLRCIGTFSSGEEKQRTKFEKRLLELEYGSNVENVEAGILFAVLKIKALCKTKNYDEILVISSDMNNIPNNYVDKLIKGLEKEMFIVRKLNNVLLDVKDMECVLDVKKCVLIESTGKSQVGEIAKLTELCIDNDVDIIGVVDII